MGLGADDSGALDTPIFRLAESQGIVSSDAFSANTLLKRMGKPEEVADVLMFLLSDKAAYVTGGNTHDIRWFEMD